MKRRQSRKNCIRYSVYTFVICWDDPVGRNKLNHRTGVWLAVTTATMAKYECSVDDGYPFPSGMAVQGESQDILLDD